MSAILVSHPAHSVEWHLPNKRRVGMTALIVGESAIFTIFVVACLLHRQEPPAGRHLCRSWKFQS